MLLLDYCRNELGLGMKAMHVGRHVGWTTDGEKAERARLAGAKITAASGQFDPRRIQGWEVSFLEGAEKRDAEEAA